MARPGGGLPGQGVEFSAAALYQQGRKFYKILMSGSPALLCTSSGQRIYVSGFSFSSLKMLYHRLLASLFCEELAISQMVSAL